MKTKNNNGWTPRRRKQQACVARRNKPWTKSTGPKTKEGKETSRLNAYKDGEHTASRKMINNSLRLNRMFLEQVGAYMTAERMEAEIIAQKRTVGKSVKDQ